MWVAVVASRNVTVVAGTRFLGLANGVGAALDRQVVTRLRRRSALFIALRPALPLTAAILPTVLEMLILWARLIVFEMLILWARLVVLGTRRLRARLVILWPWLIVTTWPPAFRSPLVLATALRALPVISFVGHCLRANGHHQQTNTCQTPDALHALPHCRLGPIAKTEKQEPGSATGYQSREQFSQAIKRGAPSVAP
jgi:hypothetical protein